MNKRDLKRLKIDPSFVITPERFITMFGIECDDIRKLNIHDLHYILGDSLKHAGVNQINLDKIYKGEILLIGSTNNFKAYYRPIIYKIKVNDTLEEKVEMNDESLVNTKLSELCDLCTSASDFEELDMYLSELYDRTNFNLDEELEPSRSKIYALSSKTKRY